MRKYNVAITPEPTWTSRRIAGILFVILLAFIVGVFFGAFGASDTETSEPPKIDRSAL